MENIHLIPNWSRSSCSQVGVCKIHVKISLLKLLFSNVSRPETSLNGDSGTGVFLWIFRNSSKSFIYRTPPDDCSCWFLRSNQNVYPLITLCSFFPSLFSFIIDNCNSWSLLRKSLKMRIFLLFAIVYKCC